LSCCLFRKHRCPSYLTCRLFHNHPDRRRPSCWTRRRTSSYHRPSYQHPWFLFHYNHQSWPYYSFLFHSHPLPCWPSYRLFLLHCCLAESQSLQLSLRSLWLSSSWIHPTCSFSWWHCYYHRNQRPCCTGHRYHSLHFWRTCRSSCC